MRRHVCGVAVPVVEVATLSAQSSTKACEINAGRGLHAEHWLNGVRVLTFELESDALMAAKAKGRFTDEPGWGTKLKGQILLPDHGDEVAFRNLGIRELPATSSART